MFYASTNIWDRSMGILKKEIERIQRKALKKIFKQPVNTSYTGLLMEIGIWVAEQWRQYVTSMSYHNIKNSNKEREIKKMIEEQEKKNYNNQFYKKDSCRNFGYWNR